MITVAGGVSSLPKPVEHQRKYMEYDENHGRKLQVQAKVGQYCIFT